MGAIGAFFYANALLVPLGNLGGRFPAIVFIILGISAAILIISNRFV